MDARATSWCEPFGRPIPEIAAINAATRTNSDRNIGLSRRRALSFPIVCGALASRSGQIPQPASSTCSAQAPTVVAAEEVVVVVVAEEEAAVVRAAEAAAVPAVAAAAEEPHNKAARTRPGAV